MRIDRPELREQQDNQVRMVARVRSRRGERDLWYSVDREWASWLTPERTDAFFVAMLPMAMRNGETLELGGGVSEKLYYNVTRHYIPILRCVMPWLKPVDVVPERIKPNPVPGPGRGVVTGFSGGIDSFCVLADHLLDNVPAGFRITHLVFNNVGSHGHAGRELFLRRYERLRPCAESLGLPFLKIDSNLDEILEFDFQQTDTLRNASAILGLQRLFARYVMASSYRYEDSFVGPTYGLEYSDPFALHLLSTESTECLLSGAQYERWEKTLRVADLPAARRYLDVCIDGRTQGNCSQCSKCLRTMFTLELLGKLEEFRDVFDLAKYRSHRRGYLLHVLASQDPYSQEIRRLARERGFHFPPSLRMTAPVYSAFRRRWRGLPGPVRQTIKGLLRV